MVLLVELEMDQWEAAGLAQRFLPVARGDSQLDLGILGEFKEVGLHFSEEVVDA